MEQKTTSRMRQACVQILRFEKKSEPSIEQFEHDSSQRDHVSFPQLHTSFFSNILFNMNKNYI